MNGRGTCARGNQVREMPGWQVHRVNTGTTGPHTVKSHHPHRTHLPQPRPGPTLNHEGLIPNLSVRNRNASANG